MITPWYKQVWPWVLMSIPFSVIIAMSITLTLASRQGDAPMVIDDYYKEGRGINVEIAKVVKAQELNITFNFRTEGDRFVLTFASGQPKELTSLLVQFYHGTQATRDSEQRVTANAQGEFVGELPAQLTGSWTITITPFDTTWRLSQPLRLPAEQSILLEPQTYGV